jgi:hypothetical protein
MTFVETISSVLGTGAGGASIAVAIYMGSVAVEKEMRAEAKRDIAAFIKNRNLIPDITIVIGLVVDAFKIIFGNTYRSIFKRSFIASFVFYLLFLIMFWLKYPKYIEIALSGKTSLASLGVWIMMIIFLSCWPDYFSLLKGRILLDLMNTRPSFKTILLLMIVDILISLTISYSMLSVLALGAYGFNAFGAMLDAILDGSKILIGFVPKHPDDIMVVTFTLTTLMTSLWTIFVVLAAIVAKMAVAVNGVMRIFTWMFDVDAHPIRVLGLVAGAVVWGGSIVYGFV